MKHLIHGQRLHYVRQRNMMPIRSKDMKESKNQKRSYFDYNRTPVNKEDIEAKSYRDQNLLVIILNMNLSNKNIL